MIHVEVINVLVSENHFLVLLKEKEGEERMIPISVGIFEANGIIMALEKVKTKRPFTYDIMKTIMEGSGLIVEKLLITKLENNIFYGLLTISQGEDRREFDIRPSDGIALSLRFDNPIYVADEVFDMIEEEEAMGKLEGLLNPQDALKAVEDISKETDMMSEIFLNDDNVKEENLRDFNEQTVEQQIEVYKAQMEKFVDEEKYEEAAKLRDQIIELERKLGRN